MNKTELVAKVAEKAMVPKKDTDAVVKLLLEEIKATVAKGESVQLIGFGTFEPRKRDARTGYNMQTGKAMKIPARTVPAFKAGKAFKEAVNPKPTAKKATKKK
jgi:DNA-binding protein HU-beta